MFTSSLHDQSVSVETERRSHNRYGLELDLSYVVHSGNRITMAGSGRSCNMSSGGLLIQTAGPIEQGGAVVAAMRWPTPGPGGERLLLVVSGRVARSERDRAALALSRHEFIPESQYRPNDLRSMLPLRMIPTRSGARRSQPRPKPGRPMILVVDGDDRQGILAKLLESYGYAVQYAERKRAIEVLAAGNLPISAVITTSLLGLERFAETVPMILTAAENADAGPDASLARRVVRRPIVLREILSAVQELGGLPHSSAASTHIR